MTAPPIPARLAHRPTVGGLVVPWITVQHADGGAALGAVHASRQDLCVRKRLCQIDGQPLGSRIVLFARQSDLDRRFVAEPGLHPECADYSARACPMLAGRMDHYRTAPRNLAGKPCAVPGCDCAGWVAHDDPDDSARVGHSAERFFAVWIHADQYRVAVDSSSGGLAGVAIPPDPLRVRLVLHEPERAMKALLAAPLDVAAAEDEES